MTWPNFSPIVRGTPNHDPTQHFINRIYIQVIRLEPLLHAGRHGSQIVVDLARLLAQDKVAHRGAGDLDVLIAPEDVDLRRVSVDSTTRWSKKWEQSTLVSARTMRVLVAFSIANFVLPSLPYTVLEIWPWDSRDDWNIQQSGRWHGQDGLPLYTQSAEWSLQSRVDRRDLGEPTQSLDILHLERFWSSTSAPLYCLRNTGHHTNIEIVEPQ